MKKNGGNDVKRYLGIIRKYGMDIIFPLELHEKILITIHSIFIRNGNRMLGHNELLDLLIKNIYFSHLSKTKIRGVINLLKRSDCLVIKKETNMKVIFNLDEKLFHYNNFITVYNKCLRNQCKRYNLGKNVYDAIKLCMYFSNPFHFGLKIL